MQKTKTKLDAIKLVGIKVRTNNKTELASQDGTGGKIFPCVQKYFAEKLFEKIPNRKNPGRTLCVYTEYESDHTGDYTYYIGEEVNEFSKIPEDLNTVTLPPQTYIKFTTNPGPMPAVLRNAWEDIWNMSAQDFGSSRAYKADFEVYDERAHDHNNLILDIFIGIK
ncbi:MAG: AraC family transcriptional regulator [Verrucomicrobia bacterium]|nr:MAG: AraC family transcriptional regulator [Verrucomicrobiota bacterium]